MKKALLLLLLASGLANAQSLQLQGGTGVPGSGYTNTIRSGAGAPAFVLGNNGDFYIDTAAHVLYGPKAAGVWPSSGISLGGGSGSPIWGAITGLLVNQTDLQSAIDAKQDVLTIGDLTEAVSSVLTITGGAGAVIGGPGVTVQAKQSGASQAGYLSSADWNTFNGKQASGNYLTALTGDASASGPGSAALTLATVNGGPGSCGDASHVCQVTTNGKGLVTSQSAVSVSQAPALTANSALSATYSATTSDTFVDCFGAVTLPATPIADETMSIYNVNSSSCTITATPNFIDNGTSTLGAFAISAHSTIRVHWDSVNTHWRYDKGFALSLDSLTQPNTDLFLTTVHTVEFETASGGSFVFAGGGSPSSGTLNYSFQNGGGDDGTTNKVVQWLDSSDALLGYVDGSGNASFTSLSGSLATSWLTGTLAAARMPALTGDVTTSAGAVATTLATVNAGPGVCGDASHVCQATTNGKGLVTSQSAVAIAIASGAVSGLAASATTDATNASNIASGTLAAARLPNPSASTLGGVESIVATSHQWNDSISTSGVPHQSRPALADIAAGVAPSGTFDFSGSTALNLPSSAGPTPTAGGDIRYDSTQNRTVAGGAGALTGSFPRLIYWAHPSSDVICAHGGDATISLEFGASCNNNTGADATAFTTFTIQPPIPAGFMVKDKMLRVRYDMVLYTTALNTGLIFNLKTSWGATQIYTNSGSSISGSLPGASFLVDCMVTAHGAPATSASMSSSCSPEVPGYGISSMVNKTSGVPVVNTSAAEALKFAVDWAATGILSGTYTSGITATGTVGQTCNLGTFNNGNSGGAATVALTGTNAIAASTPLVITNTGGNSTSAATSATASNGTATCSGTATVATVLGGTQGVAVQLRGVTVEELN